MASTADALGNHGMGTKLIRHVVIDQDFTVALGAQFRARQGQQGGLLRGMGGVTDPAVPEVEWTVYIPLSFKALVRLFVALPAVGNFGLQQRRRFG